MSVMFFGQYLLQERKINVEQLRQALDLVQKTKITFSELAVERGAIASVDAQRLEAEESDSTRPFAKLVLDYGLLSEKEATEIEEELLRRQLRLGQALIQLGYLPEADLGSLLADYHSQQAPYSVEALPLPGALETNELAAYVIDFLPKMLESLSELKLKIGKSTSYAAEKMHENVASISTVGADAISVTLSGDRDFSMALMTGMVGDQADPPNRTILDEVLGEFLNLVIGNAVVAFEQDGGRADLERPHYRQFPTEGYRFDLACTTGEVELVIAAL